MSLQENHQTKRILIILPRQLGDILLGSSIAYALREKYPHAQISWLAHPMGKQLLEGHPALNKVHYHPLWKSKKWQEFFKNPFNILFAYLKYLWGELRFLALLRQEKYDLVVDSICTPRTALQARVSGAADRLGLRTRWNRNWAYTWLCNTDSWSQKYAAQARLDLLEPVIGKAACENPPKHWLDSWIPQKDMHLQRIDALTQELDLENSPFVIFSPTHRRELRRWPGASYVQLALRIIEQHNWKVIWIWGPDEFELADELHRCLQKELLARGLPTSASLLPPLLKLSEVAVLAGRSRLWVGNSNGLSHVAVAGGARTVQIHGPTTSTPWTHPNSAKHEAVQRVQGCVKCESNTCRQGTHECMKLLTTDDVFAAFERIRKASLHSEKTNH